ncbi:MAG: hypothetical protein M3401_01975 [Actinomycetota bacterium]|nr:hypothetical protein [Actinomycetota bacterium]
MTTSTIHGTRTQSGDPRGDPWLTPDHFGQAAHEVIADLAALADHRRRSQIVSLVSEALERRSTASPALRRRLTALATIYADGFAPPQPARLLGAEVEFFGVRFDLVWNTGTHLWADEIKSAGSRLTPQIAHQCQRQLHAGQARWGAAFMGVRAVWLQTPGRALLISNTGRSRREADASAATTAD